MSRVLSCIVYRLILGINKVMEVSMKTNTILDEVMEIQEALKPLNYEVVGFDVPPQEPFTLKIVRIRSQSDGHNQ